MTNIRIVQRENLYFVQRRRFFLWFYETKVNYAHKMFKHRFDDNCFIGFPSFEDAKEYTELRVNSKTRVVYELKT